jgi:Domain of unknown function (DUF4389)
MSGIPSGSIHPGSSEEGIVMTPANPDYPIQLEIDNPERLSRLLIFVKWLLLIPHYLVLIVLGIGAWVVWIVTFFIVIATRRYPESLFNYMVGVMRWGTRVAAYLFLQTDQYPPFSLEDDPSYPVRVTASYPPEIARWRPLVNWLLVIPAAIVSSLIYVIAEVAVFFAWFAILFTAHYPQSLFDFVTIAFRWGLRVNLFTYWMTERYPPFVFA